MWRLSRNNRLNLADAYCFRLGCHLGSLAQVNSNFPETACSAYYYKELQLGIPKLEDQIQKFYCASKRIIPQITFQLEQWIIR